MKYKMYNWQLSNRYMKYKMYVCVTGNKSLIASSNEFSDFQILIDELERFGTQWEATEDGVVVFTPYSVEVFARF